MEETLLLRQMLRSAGAVLAGMLVGILLSLGMDAVMRSTAVFPPLGERAADIALVWATLYRTAFGVAGSYVTARLAPVRPMLHALVLGFLGLWANVGGTIATWNKGPEYGPHWYPIALTVLALPAAWVGGKLYLLQQAKKGR